jgi:ERCC4-type nuclease
MPDVHPHALKGAIASVAVMWRLPVLCARDPDDALRILQFLAHQLRDSDGGLGQPASLPESTDCEGSTASTWHRLPRSHGERGPARRVFRVSTIV